MQNLKIICVDCGVSVNKKSWNQKRCSPCRLLRDEKKYKSKIDQRKYQKASQNRIKKSGVNCSRCAKWTGKSGICVRCSEYVLRWKASNKDKLAEYRKRRRKEFRDRRGRILRKLLSEQSGRCIRCGSSENKWHLDHIIPKIKGGLDEEINFQVLCGPCNMSKGAKVVIDYLLS
jgi:HNH endonuclease